MRNLVLSMLKAVIPVILIAPQHAVFAATDIADLGIEHDLTAELHDEHRGEQKGRFLVPLGALETYEHELVPEDAVTIIGNRAYETYYLPDARRTRSVAEFYEPQIVSLGKLKYQCSGRTCGSSSHWANKIFDQRILYGPQQYQHYYAIELEGTGEMLMFYIGERATRKIYVHLELISPRTPNAD